MGENLKPFASLAELRARWPDMPPGSEAHAKVLLDDAADFILETVPSATEAQLSTLRRICCSVVRRSMEAGATPAGIEQFSQAAGPFSQSVKPLNPSGDFYLTKAERKALGEGRQHAFGVQIDTTATRSRHRPWCSVTFGATCSCGADLTGGDPLWEA